MHTEFQYVVVDSGGNPVAGFNCRNCAEICADGLSNYGHDGYQNDPGGYYVLGPKEEAHTGRGQPAMGPKPRLALPAVVRERVSEIPSSELDQLRQVTGWLDYGEH